MTPPAYRFQVFFVGFEPERKKELAEVLKTLKRTTGKDWLREVFKGAEEGRSPIIHESNSKADAYRIGFTLQRAGGEVAIEDLMPELEEEDI